MKLGNILQTFRQVRKVGLREFAERAQIEPSHYAACETGREMLNSHDLAKVIANLSAAAPISDLDLAAILQAWGGGLSGPESMLAWLAGPTLRPQNNRSIARQQVYLAIDGEREYQDSLPRTRTDGSAKGVGDYLTLISRYHRKAEDDWSDTAGNDAALHQIRKIAAIAVHCLEDHGAPLRQTAPATKQPAEQGLTDQDVLPDAARAVVDKILAKTKTRIESASACDQALQAAHEGLNEVAETIFGQQP